MAITGTKAIFVMRPAEGVTFQQAPRVEHRGAASIEIKSPWMCCLDADGKVVAAVPEAEVWTATIEPAKGRP